MHTHAHLPCTRRPLLHAVEGDTGLPAPRVLATYTSDIFAAIAEKQEAEAAAADPGTSEGGCWDDVLQIAGTDMRTVIRSCTPCLCSAKQALHGCMHPAQRPRVLSPTTCARHGPAVAGPSTILPAFRVTAYSCASYLCVLLVCCLCENSLHNPD